MAPSPSPLRQTRCACAPRSRALRHSCRTERFGGHRQFLQGIASGPDEPRAAAGGPAGAVSAVETSFWIAIFTALAAACAASPETTAPESQLDEGAYQRFFTLSLDMLSIAGFDG